MLNLVTDITIKLNKSDYDKLMDDYKRLEKENIEFKEKISKYCYDAIILNETINNNNKTIEELKRENEFLRKKIKDLELTNQEQNAKINLLELKFEKMENKRKFNRYLIMIQDLNRYFSLEKKLDNNKMFKLRLDRISTCHFLDDTYDKEIINEKILIIIKTLYEMPNEIKELFNKKYPNLIDSILIWEKQEIKYNDNKINDPELEEECYDFINE